MENKKKASKLYKIITAITLLVPLPVYLFLSATLFNIQADYAIDNVEVSDVVIMDDFIYTTNTDAIYEGVISYNDGHYGIYVNDSDIIKIDKHYYSLTDGKLTDIKRLEIQKQTSYKLPLTFFISAAGVLIVVLVIQGKMQWYKKYPRVSALIALLTGTVVLYILNTIIGNILGVFLVGTISWALYCLEYWVNNNMITEKEAEKTQTDLINTLREALK